MGNDRTIEEVLFLPPSLKAHTQKGENLLQGN